MAVEQQTDARGWQSNFDYPAIIKDTLLTGFVVLVLSFPIIGLRTISTAKGLTIVANFRAVILTVAAALAGRLLLNLFWAYRRAAPGPVSVGGGRADEVARSIKWLLNYAVPAALVVALVLPFLPFVDRRILDVCTLVLIYIMLGWGLNIVVGLAGLLDLGYVAFFAVGAYSYALIAELLKTAGGAFSDPTLAFLMDLSAQNAFWICLPLAGLTAALFGILLGFPVLRLRGDYLAIVTLGFGEIIRIIITNWTELTNGPDGISKIPRPTFFGLSFQRTAEEGTTSFHGFFGLEFSPMHRLIFMYYLILVLALLTNWFTIRMRRLPSGRAWEALREDEIACRSLGINPTNTKLTAFAVGAMFAGFAGSFFATRQGFISPESFTFIESAIILAIVVLGGMGSQVGVVLAAVLLIGVTEFSRDLEQYRMLVFGAAMVAIMVWRPRGLLARREPTLRLHAKGGAADGT